jgi:hypothetical protein
VNCRGALAALALLLVAAAAHGADLRLYGAMHAELDVPEFSAIVEQETGVRIVRVDPGGDPLQALADDAADLAIVENTRPFTAGLRTVLPLYRAVVHMAVRDNIDWEQWAATGHTPRIEFLGAAHTGELVAGLLFERARDTLGDYVPWRAEDGGEPDFIFYVGPLLPQKTSWFRPGFRLASMDRIDSAGAEFYSEGISYLHPQLSPAKIPALTYSLPGNEAGIDALAVDMLLLTRRDASAARIYRIVEVLLEQKARFAAAEPQLFRWLDERFDPSQLNFPLHQGTRDYLAREEPGFLERYAETFNFIVYVVALTVTGLVGLGRWRNRVRKDRIDRFYVRLLAVRRRIGKEPAEVLLEKVDALEGEAFDLLTGERLAADDSFRIFMELVAGLRRELRERC